MMNDWFGKFIRQAWSGVTTDFGPDYLGVPNAYRLKAGAGQTLYGEPTTPPPQLRLGSSPIPVTRADFNVNVGLLIAPENGYIPATNLAGYGSGEVNLTSNVGPFGGTETVRESVIYNVGRNSDNISNFFPMARYNYSSTVVTIGNVAVVSITISI